MNKDNYLVFAIVAWFGLLMTDPAMADEETAGSDGSGADRLGDFVPPDDGYDWLRLTSGEWLKGEIIGLFNEKVEFDSDILDELTIDGEDVSRVYSPRTFGVSIRGFEPVSGEIRVNERSVIVVLADGRERVFARDQLVAVTVSAERERDRWSGDMTLGINARQGNTQFIEYNMRAGAERRTELSRTFLDYIGNFNETEGERVANNHRVSLALDRFSGSRFFWRPLTGQYFRDPFQNIEHQLTLETGFGYEIFGTSETDWEVFAAAGGNWVRRDSVEAGKSRDQTSPSVTLGTDFETELTSWIDYLFQFQMTFLDEESGTYQHHLVTTLSTDLVGDVDFDVSLVWDRTEAPPPSADGTVPKQDDFRLTVGVGLDF